MSLIQILKKIFFTKKTQHNARSFVEILSSNDLELVQKTKNKLEKYKIPIYEIDHQKKDSEQSAKIILRIPEKFVNQAKSLLKGDE